jgi:hypothetical protein
MRGAVRCVSIRRRSFSTHPDGDGVWSSYPYEPRGHRRERQARYADSQAAVAEDAAREARLDGFRFVARFWQRLIEQSFAPRSKGSSKWVAQMD